MKIIANIILFLFVAFLATPTIVSALESDNDISTFFSFSEEELQKEVKEIPCAIVDVFHFQVRYVVTNKPLRLFYNVQKHDSVSEEIFSPPPELA